MCTYVEHHEQLSKAGADGSRARLIAAGAMVPVGGERELTHELPDGNHALRAGDQ